jgi:hypothetical protein
MFEFFEILPNPSLETLLIAGRAAMLLGAFWIFALAFSRWRRADDRSNAMLQSQLERTFAEVRSLHESVAVMNARLESMSERNDVDARRAPAGAGSQRGYDVATRMARNGADIGELVSSCGVTRHEAELLVRLHNARDRGAAAPATRGARPQQDKAAEAPRAAAPAPNPVPASMRKRGSMLSVVG